MLIPLEKRKFFYYSKMTFMSSKSLLLGKQYHQTTKKRFLIQKSRLERNLEFLTRIMGYWPLWKNAIFFTIIVKWKVLACILKILWNIRGIWWSLPVTLDRNRTVCMTLKIDNRLQTRSGCTRRSSIWKPLYFYPFYTFLMLLLLFFK